MNQPLQAAFRQARAFAAQSEGLLKVALRDVNNIGVYYGNTPAELATNRYNGFGEA